MRVREVGGSERRAVMVRIGIETSSHAKAGRLPTGLSSQDGLTEPVSTRFFPLGANVPLGGMLSPGVGGSLKMESSMETIICKGDSALSGAPLKAGRPLIGVEWNGTSGPTLDSRIAEGNKAKEIGVIRCGSESSAKRSLTPLPWSAKASAVRRVAANRGKRTAGVDRELWDSPEARWEAIGRLKRRGYRPMPLRRVFIPKSDGKGAH
ncbi:reverse transcriptase N-terminal domain-containing protein [Cupriavidus basilensis]